MATYNKAIHGAGGYRRAELPAASTITPGMLIETTSAGKVQAHSTTGGFAERSFANEDVLQGKTVEDNYAANDPVTINIELPGSTCLGLLKAGSNYSIGTKLISAGDGTLKPTTGSPSQIIAICTEAIDLSASSAVNTLSGIRVL